MNALTSNAKLAIQLGELLQTLEGKTIHIQESITRDRSRGYDRHCSITNSFTLTVEKVMWQISGGNFYLYGISLAQYAFSTGELTDISSSQGKHTIIESFEQKTERRTIIEIC